MSAELLSRREDSTLVLTLSDPAARNALSPQISAAGIEALNVAETDAGLRCVVLTGAGGHFSAGGNLQRLLASRDADPEVQASSIEQLHHFVEALRSFPKPVIAAVEGAAAGAGFSLALACDLIVAADDARFVLSHGRIGLSPDGGASWHLAQALPRALAQQIIWLAEPVSAQQLQQHGLVNVVTDSGQALTRALELAARLAQMAPNAVSSGKALLQQGRRGTLSEQLDRERQHFLENFFHPNTGEGLQAFLAKRAPRFR